jgi:hypothetical protein
MMGSKGRRGSIIDRSQSQSQSCAFSAFLHSLIHPHHPNFPHIWILRIVIVPRMHSMMAGERGRGVDKNGVNQIVSILYLFFISLTLPHFSNHADYHCLLNNVCGKLSQLSPKGRNPSSRLSRRCVVQSNGFKYFWWLRSPRCIFGRIIAFPRQEKETRLHAQAIYIDGHRNTSHKWEQQ